MKDYLVRARAPLRLGLGGGGTDVSPYCDDFGGLVLNAAINRYCHVTVAPRDDGKLRLHSADFGNIWEGDAPEFLGAESGAPTLMRGVYNRMVRDYCGGRPLPLTIVSYADAPAGSGLGTSSAMVVALLAAFQELLRLPLGTYELAHLAFEIERIDLALSGGRQDQYAAAFGGANFMEFYANDRVIINPLRLPKRTLHELESSLVIYFTGTSRASAEIIDEQRRNMGRPDDKPMEALHNLKRSAVSMKEALLRGEIATLATLLDESWAAKKQTASRIANAEIDSAYNTAKRAGALGGKVSGAGGGGFMMFLIDPVKREEMMRNLRELGGRPETCQVCSYGAESWSVR